MTKLVNDMRVCGFCVKNVFIVSYKVIYESLMIMIPLYNAKITQVHTNRYPSIFINQMTVCLVLKKYKINQYI